MNQITSNQETTKHKKLSKVTSYSLEHGTEGKRLRKQAVVTSISTGCLSGDAADAMPKISSMRPLNRSVQHLVKEDLELRPGQRPPTPARQSLPNLLPTASKQTDPSKSDAWLASNPEVRRITLGGVPRSASPSTFFKHKRALSTDIDLTASIRSEGWGQAVGGGVVHLPPITKGRQDKRLDENRLTVAKKTLEQLDTVLSPDESLVHLHAHSRPPVQTHT